MKNIGDYVWNINRDLLDFRKENLKIVDRDYMKRMTKGTRGSSSVYKGVSWDKRDKKWKVQFSYKGFKVAKYSNSEIKAALIYNEIAKEVHGEECYLNVIGSNNFSETLEEVEGKAKSRSARWKKFKGIYKDNLGYYICTIYKDGQPFYLGYFKDEIEAAETYDKKAVEFFGDKAILNFPLEEKVNE